MTEPTRFRADVPFSPLPGAAGPHAQTILGWLLRAPRRLDVERVRWGTPDGDFLDADVLSAPAEHPHLIVLHGLEGSSRAGYVREVLQGAASRGWGALALNFRSCSGEPNRSLRAYNSGDTTDALFAVERLRARGVSGPLVGVGFSLGGSVLLNLMARAGNACPLEAGAAISVPFDLDACAARLDTGRGATALYRELFLLSLKSKTLAQCRRMPGRLDEAAIRKARGIRAFDDAVTAPLFGYSSAEAYYADCSAGPRLRDVRKPALVLTSLDDPLAPASALSPNAAENAWLSVVMTSRGGHVGFVGGTWDRPSFWAEAQALHFFEQVLEEHARPVRN
jgi:uncharacterized protein